jgi:hypothetical protein
MKAKYVIISFIVLSALFSCSNETALTKEQTIIEGNPFKSLTFETEGFEKSEILRIKYTQGNNNRGLTYNLSTPLSLPDGTVVSEGDLKPTWQYIENRLGINIDDKADATLSASTMLKEAYEDGFQDAAIYGGNSIADDLMIYGAQGYFVNLKDYLKYMPHVRAYFNENPSIAKAITSYDGGIYHLPYVAELDYYARVLTVRPDWITALLDGKVSLERENAQLNVHYQGYWNRYDRNVITRQNQTARASVLERDKALQTLITYINETYPELKNPSDLYLGETAQYDMDELVALWRVIRLSPRTLSRVTTGNVIEEAKIIPFFARKSNYREDLLRLLSFFDGERCHAFDSYTNSQFYVDEEGEMHFSYAEESFLSKVNYLQQFYAEGLINEGLTNTKDKTDFRQALYFSDSSPDQKEFGFMTLDWIASTTKGEITGVLPPVTTLTGAGIYSFIHYIENTRSIKPDGWAISTAASEEERNAAFLLFDYIFSEEGSNIQNYSIPDGWMDDEIFTGSDKKNYPKYNQWSWDMAEKLKGGDLMGFEFEVMGSRISLGYKKELGAELQATTENGFATWDLYTKSQVLTPSYSSTTADLQLMPPYIPLTQEELDYLKDNKVKIGTSQRNDIFNFIAGNSNMRNALEIQDSYKKQGIDQYLKVYQEAYNRMTEDM